MSKDKHSPITGNNEFCSVRPTSKCDCPERNDYRNICKPSWSSYKWQAHHVLPDNCVNELPEKKKERKALLRVLAETQWCINNVSNMIALPMYLATTVNYYYKRTIIQSKFMTGAPPFQDLPQHSNDHRKYDLEIKQDLRKVWKDATEAGKDHKVSAAEVKGRLKGLSYKWKRKLESRGLREGGTHAAWFMGLKDPKSKWYLPFSMTSRKKAKRLCFPVSGHFWHHSWDEFKNLFRARSTF